ncbi:MAG: tetratricopeptide repeat protein, partial [Chloroflexi bacterium]|nr:tetratricopeptide repeat protein [Chloroflexota bacterium]
PARRSLILWAGLAAVVVIALLVGVAFVLPALNAPAAPTEAPIVTVEPVATDHYMVLVAQLERLDGEERDFARFVVENLQQSFEDDAPFSRLTVRAYPAVINSAESALAAAEANSASVIIWGNYSGDLVELNINVGSTTPYQNLTMPRATLEQVANIRVQLANARAQSVAPQVVGVMAALLAADGITYELARNLSVVQQLTGEGITISGMSLAARYHRAVLNFFADPDAAVTELDAATELTATNPLLYSLRALIELRSGNIAAVNADTATAARLGPEDWALPLFATATAAIFFQNDPEQGVAILTQAVEAVPNNWFAYVFRATAYYSIGDYEAALRDVEQSIALGPQSNIPYTLGASIAMRQNRVDDARRLAAQALELFPDPTEVNRTVAAAFGEGIAVTLQAVAFTNMSLGQYDAALTNVQSIIDSGQATADAYLIQGLAYCNLRQYPAAIEAYGAGIELAPEFWLLYLLRAEVYQKDGNLMGALRDVQAVQRSAAAESYADLIARGMSGEEGLDCESFFSAPAS